MFGVRNDCEELILTVDAQHDYNLSAGSFNSKPSALASELSHYASLIEFMSQLKMCFWI